MSYFLFPFNRTGSLVAPSAVFFEFYDSLLPEGMSHQANTPEIMIDI